MTFLRLEGFFAHFLDVIQICLDHVAAITNAMVGQPAVGESLVVIVHRKPEL